jgi:hypothetical protein
MKPQAEVPLLFLPRVNPHENGNRDDDHHSSRSESYPLRVLIT